MSVGFHQAVMTFISGWSMISLVAAGIALALAAVNWRTPSRYRLLGWAAVLGSSPVAAATIHLAILHWVHGIDAGDSRTFRIFSGIGMCLLSALLLMAAAAIRRRSAAAWVTRLMLMAAVPFLVSALHAASLFYGLLPELAQPAREPRPARDDPARVHLGDRAPRFQVQTVEGPPFDLEEHSGRVILLNFYASWCGPCLTELPLLEEIWQEYKDHPEFSMLVVGREETATAVKAFRHRHHFSFPMAADANRSIFSLFADEFIPRTFLIARTGEVRMALADARSEDLAKVRQALDDELANR